MSIKSVLEGLYEAGEYHKRAKSNKEYKKKDIEQAHSAILAEFEKMLPEKRIVNKEGNRIWDTTQLDLGYNQCLQDIKSKLAEEKGEIK